MANHLAFLPWETHEQYKKARDMTPEDDLPRLVSAKYATGEEWRNNSKKNEEAEPKCKWCPVVDVAGGESNVSDAVKNNIA